MPFDIDTIKQQYWTKDLLSCYHVDYGIQKDEWEKIRLAYHGGDPWVAGSLQKYECESAGSFTFRTNNAVNHIAIKTPIESMQNIARGSKAQARVENAHPRVQAALDNDFDNNGNSWFTWLVDEGMSNLPVYGKFFIFASTPAQVSQLTKEDEKDFAPYAFGRNPLQVINWRYENGNTLENGQFSDILFLTTEMVLDQNTRYETQIEIAIRITKEFVIVMAVDNCRAVSGLDGNGLFIYDDFEAGEVIRVSENPHGKVMCRCVDIGRSIVVDGVNISRQAMNIQTASFTSTFDGNFTQKWVSGSNAPGDGDDNELGENNIMYFTDAATKYNATPNPTNTVDNAVAFITDLQNSFDNKMQNSYNNLAKQGSQVPSGEALKEINAPQNQAVGYEMDQFGDAMIDIVSWMHELISVPIPDNLIVIMPDSYESTTEQDRITTALDVQDLTAVTLEGMEIIETKKWELLAPADQVEEISKAEADARWQRAVLTSEIDSAGDSVSGDTEDTDTAGDGINQAGAEE